jgi:hypothetical protein
MWREMILPALGMALFAMLCMTLGIILGSGGC